MKTVFLYIYAAGMIAAMFISYFEGPPCLPVITNSFIEGKTVSTVTRSPDYFRCFAKMINNGMFWPVDYLTDRIILRVNSKNKSS